MNYYEYLRIAFFCKQSERPSINICTLFKTLLTLWYLTSSNAYVFYAAFKIPRNNAQKYGIINTLFDINKKEWKDKTNIQDKTDNLWKVWHDLHELYIEKKMINRHYYVFLKTRDIPIARTYINSFQ